MVAIERAYQLRWFWAQSGTSEASNPAGYHLDDSKPSLGNNKASQKLKLSPILLLIPSGSVKGASIEI
ncbi:hypothetical protein HUJ04_004572 [Dendroctonus ponderosae]|nr:hypothetical protein HUJ04_004572 [Dendroctonus ponderosae]